MDPILVQLKSVSIFWPDIGLPIRLTDRQRDILGVWWEEEVAPWIRVAIKGHYNPHESGVWFAEPRDAALFMLRFTGQTPNLQ